MRRQLFDTGLGQTITWIWLGFLVAGLGAWLGYRYWRRRHPSPQPAPELSYSERLQERLSKRQGTAGHPKRRDRPVKSHRRRH